MLGSIFLHGFCSTNLQGKFARYRNLFADNETEAPQCRIARWDGKKYSGQCQQQTRLENLCGFCPDTNSESEKIIRGRKLRHRTQTGCLCVRRNNDRFMPFFISLGQISPDQGSDKATYSFGFEGQYTDDDYHNRGQYSRCKHPGRVMFGATGNLYHGSRLSGFRQVLRHSHYTSIFCDQGKKESRFQAIIFATDKKSGRNQIRPDRNSNKLLFQKTLPGKNSAYWLFRCGNQETVDISDQQHEAFGKDHCRSLQITLASRTFLQMDKAAFANQGILWDIRERSKNTNLDRDIDLCADRYYSEGTQFKAVTLHNSTDFERGSFRENAHFTGVCGGSLC